MADPRIEAAAQAIWQTYAVEIGRSLPPGLADKLAVAASEAMDQQQSYPLCPGCGHSLDESHVGSCYGLG